MTETNPLLLEIRNIQNPALGAALLWRFAVGFKNSHKFSQSVEFQLLFLVLPILWNEELFAEVQSTQSGSGLHRFVAKFSDRGNLKQDILIGLHSRASQMKEQ